MVDYTTTVEALVNRAIVQVTDDIATEGLKALRRILIKSGFLESEHLKNFELSADISGGVITFNITIEAEAIEMDEKEQKEQKEREQKLNETKSMHKVVEHAIRSYKLVGGRVVKIGDSRSTAADRMAAHTVALRNPRGMKITPTGKLFISLKKSLKKLDTRKFRYPKKGPEGISKNIIDEITKVVLKEFSPEIIKIAKRLI
jgi:hypothetical protein